MRLVKKKFDTNLVKLLLDYALEIEEIGNLITQNDYKMHHN